MFILSLKMVMEELYLLYSRKIVGIQQINAMFVGYISTLWQLYIFKNVNLDYKMVFNLFHRLPLALEKYIKK